MTEFNLAVIGSGPGGYVAAIRASQLGMKTVIIEREQLGGVCLNWGCIPTKALLASAEHYRAAKEAIKFGIECQNIKLNLEQMVSHSRDAAAKLSKGVQHLLNKNNVTLIDGNASLDHDRQIKVTKEQNVQYLQAQHIIIATGARARVLDHIKPDGQLIWSYKEAMVPKFIPKSLIIVGSGAIGIEFATFYHTIGSQVTVVEIADRILGSEDEEIAQIAHQTFSKQGIQIKTKTTLEIVDYNQTQITAKLSNVNGQEIVRADAIIVAAGIVPNSSNLGLEKTSIRLENNFIVTDEFMRTDQDCYYAIGDVTAAPWLAHKASHQGMICVEKIANLNPAPLNPSNIPGCVYSYPELASIGYTEQKALALGHKVKVGRFPFMANGKAISIGEPMGMIKVIIEEQTGEILGTHMIGAKVTELIHSMALARQFEATAHDIVHTIFPHPTLSEAIPESILQALGRAIHI